MTNTNQRAAADGTRFRMSRVPDGAIRAYFALFPVVVALFLSVQAVRAHELGAETAKQVSAAVSR